MRVAATSGACDRIQLAGHLIGASMRTSCRGGGFIRGSGTVAVATDNDDPGKKETQDTCQGGHPTATANLPGQGSGAATT